MLDGALALAVPTQFGQSFLFESDAEDSGTAFVWKSLNKQEDRWFKGFYHKEDLSFLNSFNDPVGMRLFEIFSTIRKMNPEFKGFATLKEITSRLEFPREWGLGTSSTLIAALAEWANVSAYDLLQKTFGGSGYDLACANSNGPILYQIRPTDARTDSTEGHYVEVPYRPPFHEHLYFVYLGKKQNSREGIQRFRAQGKAPENLLKDINQLSLAWLQAGDLNTLEKVILQHESIVASYLNIEKVQDLYFKDYWGLIKSLGAWGGDFVMATSDKNAPETKAYFQKKGFNTIFSYQELILAQPNS